VAEDVATIVWDKLGDGIDGAICVAELAGNPVAWQALAAVEGLSLAGELNNRQECVQAGDSSSKAVRSVYEMAMTTRLGVKFWTECLCLAAFTSAGPVRASLPPVPKEPPYPSLGAIPPENCTGDRFVPTEFATASAFAGPRYWGDNRRQELAKIWVDIGRLNIRDAQRRTQFQVRVTDISESDCKVERSAPFTHAEMNQVLHDFHGTVVRKGTCTRPFTQKRLPQKGTVASPEIKAPIKMIKLPVAYGDTINALELVGVPDTRLVLYGGYCGPKWATYRVRYIRSVAGVGVVRDVMLEPTVLPPP